MDWLTKRTTINLCALMIGCIALLLFWQKLHNPLTLPLQSIKIEGQLQHISREQLEHILLPKVMAQGFFTVDVAAIKTELLNDPWVAQAAISRVWPHTILVEIHEQHAIARWGKYSLLNDKGDVFTPQTLPDVSQLPQLSGPEGFAKTVLEQFRNMQALLAPLQLTIQTCRLSPIRAWQITLSDGTVLALGREHIIDRLQRFVIIHTHKSL